MIGWRKYPLSVKKSNPKKTAANDYDLLHAKISTSPSLSWSLTLLLSSFCLYSLLFASFAPINPPPVDPLHTFLFSPFHMEEQLLSPLLPFLPSSPTLPLLSTTHRSRGNHTVWTKCATNLSDDVCFPLLLPYLSLSTAVCFNAVYIFDKVLWNAPRCTCASIDRKFALSLMK